MTPTSIVTRDEWLAARKELLAEEKQLIRQRDALSAKRRQLPWVKVDTEYTFTGPDGTMSLADLFGSRSQLIIQHFMLGEGWAEGCPSCSFWADGFDGTDMHLAHRDAAFVNISIAPLAEIEAYKKRMGWSFAWVSSHGTSFNYDFNVSFTAEQFKEGSADYNYRKLDFEMSELPGISIFAKDDSGAVYHTYSCFSRGLDNMNVAYQYMDLLPKGRDEGGLPSTMAWLKRHDAYED